MADFRTLEMYPAFGFETYDRWRVAAHQYEKKMGYETAKPGEGLHNYQIWAKPIIDEINASKIWGYIPLVNIIVGIVRIMFYANNINDTTSEDKPIAKWHMGRGIAEILIGPLLFIPDLILTCWDKSVVKAYLLKHPEAATIRLGNGYSLRPILNPPHNRFLITDEELEALHPHHL